MRHTTSPPSARTASLGFPRRALAVLLLAGVATGCAGARKSAPDVTWPPAPDLPRIQYVRAIKSEKDISSGFFASLGQFLVQRDSDLAVDFPTGVALDPSERYLFVVGPSRAVKIDLQSGSFSRLGAAHPPAAAHAVAVDAKGNVYLSDHRGDVVLVYAPTGEFLREIGRGVLDQPTGIAVDRRAQILYVVAGADRSSRKHRIEAFSLAGKHLRTIGTRGQAPGQFNFPVDVDVGPDGRLYVADMLNFRVQILEADGTPVGVFGSAGQPAPGMFQKVKAVALDAFDNLHVSDGQASMIQMFNSRAQPLMTYGGGEVVLPGAIVISSRNDIFVTDYSSGVVHQMKLINTKREDSFESPAPPKDR
ncbi:MAG TPA: hypothetical protein VFL83_21425 [Anaeromyxobacter sp.]|nr:hypothetical protein [Anaeromyxobacter sp.]